MSPSTTTSVDLLGILSALQHLNASRYLCVASLVLSVYDWILLAGDESMTIWKTRWTLPKAIYYFNRVVTPFGMAFATFQLSDLRTVPLSKTTFLFLHSSDVLNSTALRSCQVFAFSNCFLGLFSLFLSNLLLTLRLVALYNRKRWIQWFLWSFLLVSYAGAVAFMFFAIRAFGLNVQYSLLFHTCSSDNKSSLMPGIFLAPMAFEATLFILTGYRAWQDAKIMEGAASAPFLTILYRDGMICFFVMFGLRVWNVWILATQPLSSAYLGIYIIWAASTILSTRIYLNLVFLAQGPILERERSEAPASRVYFSEPPPPSAGIRMKIQTTTYADYDSAAQGRRRTTSMERERARGSGRISRKLDSVVDVDSVELQYQDEFDGYPKSPDMIFLTPGPTPHQRSFGHTSYLHPMEQGAAFSSDGHSQEFNAI